MTLLYGSIKTSSNRGGFPENSGNAKKPLWTSCVFTTVRKLVLMRKRMKYPPRKIRTPLVNPGIAYATANKKNASCPTCGRKFSLKSAIVHGHQYFCKTGCLKKFNTKIVEMGAESVESLNQTIDVAINSEEFFSSREWLSLRYQVLRKFGRRCMCCGVGSDSAVLQVDHILPRFKYPGRALDIDNLQVLCKECNFGKGARFTDDFRPQPKESK